MTCPACGAEAVNKESKTYCPSCEIFLGNLDDTFTIPRHQTRTVEDKGEVFQKRNRKRLVVKILSFTLLTILILGGVGYFMLNFTAYGYREKIFYRYGITREASTRIRGMYIEVANISETKPLGLSHSGYWKPKTESIRLNTASDEVAIHEFAHAWWEDLRKNSETKINLVNDTILLSKMGDEKYTQTTAIAQWIVGEFCPCPDLEKINYKLVDDHHFYAYLAGFTMGQHKEGSHQLPEFMWKYFDDLFSGNLRVVPCYETQSCYFPSNNDPTLPWN